MTDNNRQMQRRPQGGAPQQQRQGQSQGNAPAKQEPRYAERMAQVAADIEKDKLTLAKLMKAEPDSAEFGQFVNEVSLAIHKAYKKDGSNPLLDATPASLRSSIREAAGFGYSLNPRLGDCYLIPRSGVVEMQSGYKGLNKLAWRSGILSSLHADCVYKGESYERFGGTERPRIEHKPDDTGTKRTNKWPDILCAYATAFVGDSKHAVFQVAPKWRLGLARGNGTTDAWKGHPDAMCRKTALIMLASELPRHDKLRDFHLAVEHEVALELDSPEFFVAMDDGSEDAGREWLEAVGAYASLGVTEQNLLDYFGINAAAEITSENLATLETLFRRGRNNDKEAAAEFEKMRVGPQPAVEASAEASVETDQPDAGPQPVA
jgi:recombinational DNA repair protein RecT